MPRKVHAPIYWRNGRAYLDARAYSDVGGGQERLVPPGERLATSDPLVAQKLAAERIADLQGRRRNKHLLGVERQTTLEEYAALHLMEKARAGQVTDAWLEESEKRLRDAVEFFGAGRDPASITPRDVRGWAHELSKRPGRGGKTLSPGSVRHYLNALSNLYQRAQSDGYVLPGYNPVAALLEKPKARHQEARWLEVHEAALLLEAARTYPYDAPDDSTAGNRLASAIREVLGPGVEAEAAFVERMRSAGKHATAARLRGYMKGEKLPTADYLRTAARVLDLPERRLYRPRGWLPPARPPRMTYPLLATFLLTGGRESEILGLEVEDVSFDRNTITFREHPHRRLKTRTSRRVVPLWPQLREILQAYIFDRSAPLGRLLFPSSRAEEEAMVTDWRKSLDATAERAGWKPGGVRSKMFRHTYCAARLQTLDRGHPVSEYTVAREMGHGGTELVRRVYGHLGTIRHRAEVVEYRVEQHQDRPEIRERLEAMQAARS